MKIDPRLLELHFSEISNEWATASLNCYSNAKKLHYHEQLGRLYGVLAQLDFHVLSDAELKEVKGMLDFFTASLTYLKNSTINTVPYELIYALRCAMKDWIGKDAENYILVTSYADYCILYTLALFQDYQCMEFQGIKFPSRLIQICLPKANEKNYLSNVALYHELGHFIAEKYNICPPIALSLWRNREDKTVRYFFWEIEKYEDKELLFARFRDYIMEYFADLFAAQYIGRSLIHYLEYVACDGEDNQTHPATQKRCELMEVFLKGDENHMIFRFFQSATRLMTGSRLEKRNMDLPASADFYRLLPYCITDERQLHSLFQIGWDIWLYHTDEFERENQIPPQYKLKPQQKFNMLNNLIEKSINNYIVIQNWKETHE